jgi:hypothetical protein
LHIIGITSAALAAKKNDDKADENKENRNHMEINDPHFSLLITQFGMHIWT